MDSGAPGPEAGGAFRSRLCPPRATSSHSRTARSWPFSSSARTTNSLSASPSTAPRASETLPGSGLTPRAR